MCVRIVSESHREATSDRVHNRMVGQIFVRGNSTNLTNVLYEKTKANWFRRGSWFLFSKYSWLESNHEQHWPDDKCCNSDSNWASEMPQTLGVFLRFVLCRCTFRGNKS